MCVQQLTRAGGHDTGLVGGSTDSYDPEFHSDESGLRKHQTVPGQQLGKADRCKTRQRHREATSPHIVRVMEHHFYWT
jgi:hypothetical protein